MQGFAKLIFFRSELNINRQVPTGNGAGQLVVSRIREAEADVAEALPEAWLDAAWQSALDNESGS